MSEPLSPDDIEKATFTSTHGGYDPDEVAVFLKSVADDMRALIRKQETAEMATERPYHALGREIADLMEVANEAAMRAKKLEHPSRGAQELPPRSRGGSAGPSPGRTRVVGGSR